jgi:hypothetical protein
MINSGREWDWMDSNIKTKAMIYRSIEKVILETPNDMELGKKIRRLYLREVADDVDDIIEDSIDDYISVPTVDKPTTSIED